MRGEVTRTRILEAATELFVQHGFEATSVNAIARAANVSVPLLYWHFKSKASICFACLERAMRRFAEHVLEKPDKGSPRERLETFVRDYVRAQLEDLQGSSAYGKLYTFGQLLTSLEDEHRERLIEFQRQVVDRLRAILRDGQATGEFTVTNITVTSFAIASACEYVFEWFDPDGPLSIDEVADQYATMMAALAGGVTTP